MTIDIDEEPTIPKCVRETLTSKHEARKEEEIEIPFSVALDKENSHPNLEPPRGRLSL